MHHLDSSQYRPAARDTPFDVSFGASPSAGEDGLIEITQQRIVYEDGHLLAVDKPSGLVCHPTVDPARDHLIGAVSRWLQHRDGEPGYLRLIHRLDVGTSGVTIFSRRPESDSVLGDAFATRSVSKVYWAIVVRATTESPPSEPLHIRSYLAPGAGPKGRTSTVRSGGRPAHTVVRALELADDIALVEARPHTGRTHQIRVHLAELGFPILGDTLYGGEAPDAKRLMLHARSLELAHPSTAEDLHIEAPAPRAFVRRFASLRSRSST
jgi:23S rRNA pseudouridine1911/1915/1917 synthase